MFVLLLQEKYFLAIFICQHTSKSMRDPLKRSLQLHRSQQDHSIANGKARLKLFCLKSKYLAAIHKMVSQ